MLNVLIVVGGLLQVLVEARFLCIGQGGILIQVEHGFKGHRPHELADG